MSDQEKANDGGPAFPVSSGPGFVAGMSLRDWFAGQALSGLLTYSNTSGSPEGFVRDAYKYADTMIAERNKSK